MPRTSHPAKPVTVKPVTHEQVKDAIQRVRTVCSECGYSKVRPSPYRMANNKIRNCTLCGQLHFKSA